MSDACQTKNKARVTAIVTRMTCQRHEDRSSTLLTLSRVVGNRGDRGGSVNCCFSASFALFVSDEARNDEGRGTVKKVVFRRGLMMAV
jgi:hypothetical protein